MHTENDTMNSSEQYMELLHNGQRHTKGTYVQWVHSTKSNSTLSGPVKAMSQLLLTLCMANDKATRQGMYVYRGV